MRDFIRRSMLWLLLLPFAMNALGAASNQLVLFVNNDKFPVMINQKHLQAFVPEGVNADGMMDTIHCVMTHHTHLNLLADIFDFHNTIESIGDLLMEWSNEYGTYICLIWAVLMIKRVGKGEQHERQTETSA